MMSGRPPMDMPPMHAGRLYDLQHFLLNVKIPSLSIFWVFLKHYSHLILCYLFFDLALFFI